jgi:pyridoxal phosphate enzyme (YggS family)
MLKDKLLRVRETIETARAKAGRKDGVTLLCATKGVAVERLREAADLELTLFGENRMQDALPKIRALAGADVTWHFIGTLQKNKAAAAVEHFAMVQSVDSIGLARKLQGAAMDQEKILSILIEINIGGEPNKSGLPVADLPALLDELSRLNNLRFEGIMCIPPYHPDPERSRPYFVQMREIFEKLAGLFPHVRHLSMGMSEDYWVAVEEGATIVRLGRALFGDRI